MKYQLNNHELCVTIDSFGAEILSIQKEGLEYIWKGDACHWSGHAPHMFPICGALREGIAHTREGKQIHLSRHGLARTREFVCDGATDTEICFSLEADQESLSLYPFLFHLTITYRIEGATLHVSYQVKNQGKEELFYCIGSHPAFQCPLKDDELVSDYHLIFEKPETIEAPCCLENSLIDGGNRVPLLKGSTIFSLDEDLRGMGCVVLDELQSRRVRLEGPDKKGVSLDFSDFPYLVLWTASKEAPFIAIEPCTGLGTYTEETDVFEEKRGMVSLAPKEFQHYTYQMTFSS